MYRTPLHVAVVDQQVEVVEQLIKNKVDLNSDDAWNMTPLHIAIETRNLKIIKLLLDAGADVYANIFDHSKTPLYSAIKTSDTNILNLFLNAIGKKNPFRYTPLHMAAEWGNLNTVKMLIDSGAALNTGQIFEDSPLHWAIKSGNINVIKLLIDSGANVNANIGRNTPLHVAVGADCSIKVKNDKSIPINRTANVLKLLMCAGANTNVFNANNITPFRIFIKNMSALQELEGENYTFESFKLLIETTDVNLTDATRKNLISSILELKYTFNFRKHLSHQKFCQKIIEHIAKFKKLNLKVDQSLCNTIYGSKEHNSHFEKCNTELDRMKNLKLNKCWVTFFDLLINDKTKLVKYAGNPDLVEDFNKKMNNFPIYKDWMRINMTNAIIERKFFDNAADVLGYFLPIFHPSHLVIREILYTLHEENWKNLIEKKRYNEYI